LLFAVLVLFVEIPCRVPIEVLPTSLFGARDLGSSPGFANFQDEVELGHSIGNNHHNLDASWLEQRSPSLVGTATVDSELGVVLASVVSGRNGTASGLKGWIGRQRRPTKRAAATNRNVVGPKHQSPLDGLVRSWPRRENMANELTLTVNGAKQIVSAAPETPLIFVLRNELKLSGPRLGCGMAQCGACSVLLDGEEIRTCITPVSYAVGKKVTTIEGLPAVWAAQKSLSAADAAKTLHPVQQAWIDEQVPQCGYCQSGMMIAAVQLLSKNPNPTVAQIKDAFTNTPPSPHLCRCGTYAAIIDAVQRAAQAMKAGAR
jgi:aerobic-type carbon monoxide dehydrogenase small subunit (CoxS/CutS family)